MRKRKAVINSLDRLASQASRKLNPECQKCGKPATEVHHLIGRRNYSVRWTLCNLLPVCSGCHMFRNDSFEQDPYSKENENIARRHVEKDMPWDAFRLLASKPYKATLDELIELETLYKQILSD